MKSFLSFILVISFVLKTNAQNNDSVQLHNNRLKFEGTKLILPVSLMLAGIAINGEQENSIKNQVKNLRNEEIPNFHTGFDDYLQFAPLFSAYAFDYSGMKARTDSKNRAALLLKSQIFTLGSVYLLKKGINNVRPDGSAMSFPSGHTAEAFAGATFLATEYGNRYKWVPYFAYGTAATVGALRVANNKHYVSDVLFGAGLGILSTKIAYWTHQYKWNKTTAPSSGFDEIYKNADLIKENSNLALEKEKLDSSSVKNTIKVQEYAISPSEIFIYTKPKISNVWKGFAQNLYNTATDMISKKVYPYSLGAVGATALMIPADPYLLRNARNLGESLGFTYDHTYLKNSPMQAIPANLNTWMYFMGNGTSVFLMSGGFAAYGLITKDFRSQSVAAQLVQSVLLSGVFTQSLKHFTGRESPFITTGAGREHSRWELFPKLETYAKDTSRYDAMPSGHLTTGLAAWTILAENYPEVKWIKPLGYSILGLMSYEMVQSGVHWVSDYPIAVLFGYLIGKNISKSAFQRKNISIVNEGKTKYKLEAVSSNFGGVQTYGFQIKF